MTLLRLLHSNVYMATYFGDNPERSHGRYKTMYIRNVYFSDFCLTWLKPLFGQLFSWDQLAN